jgi:hypothetical protein
MAPGALGVGQQLGQDVALQTGQPPWRPARCGPCRFFRFIGNHRIVSLRVDPITAREA